MPAQLTLVYDASKVGLDLSMLPIAILGLVAAVVIGVFSFRRRIWLQAIFAAVFSVVWVVSWSLGLYAVNSKRVECARLVRTGQYSVVEGQISEFHPMPYGGHAVESFVVNGVRFEYSDYDMSRGGFNQTESHGGPIHSTSYVRVAYNDGRILQLWVLRSQP